MQESVCRIIITLQLIYNCYFSIFIKKKYVNVVTQHCSTVENYQLKGFKGRIFECLINNISVVEKHSSYTGPRLVMYVLLQD